MKDDWKFFVDIDTQISYCLKYGVRPSKFYSAVGLLRLEIDVAMLPQFEFKFSRYNQLRQSAQLRKINGTRILQKQHQLAKRAAVRVFITNLIANPTVFKLAQCTIYLN
ncbi:hypothetical protein TWF225_009875 [Orbilia oligospora]|nr:hypothetical protein TWF225_009875 [Orbilia oligospora]KAF3266356.1 hypothetical protein TWF128_010770 [Orbilia oligospora]KAF3269277.1 hypothetical protein TWF217_009368 [Orbilia oligospora]KAF3291653.1 hypothetical protein TWF132_006640 [Orbilia oligospora]